MTITRKILHDNSLDKHRGSNNYELISDESGEVPYKFRDSDSRGFKV